MSLASVREGSLCLRCVRCMDKGKCWLQRPMACVSDREREKSMLRLVHTNISVGGKDPSPSG